MIYAKTWKPGTDKPLDDLFETLREEFYLSGQNSIWYTKKHFEQCIALTISFNDDTPIFCASILQRKIWPDGVFRIMNRYWRIGNNRTIIKTISPGTTIITQDQINWLKLNTNFKLAFISRQYNHWQKFVIDQYKMQLGIEFQTDNYLYTTCENILDDSCWQKIVYIGDSSVLSKWNRK